jgi:hypothetical protein
VGGSAEEVFDSLAEAIEFLIEVEGSEAFDSFGYGVGAFGADLGGAVVAEVGELREAVLDIFEERGGAIPRGRCQGACEDDDGQAESGGCGEGADGVRTDAGFKLGYGGLDGGKGVGDFKVGAHGCVGVDLRFLQSSNALAAPRDRRTGRTSIAPIPVAAPTMTRVGMRCMRSPTPKAVAMA